MAPRLFLALVTVVGIMWYLAWYHRADPRRRNQSLIQIALWGAAALLVILAIAKGSWLMAMFGAALPWINRLMMVKRLWDGFGRGKAGAGHGQPQPPPSISTDVAKALEILGLEPGASKEEIIEAHRRLMQKIHPDRGGSDYLAGQINLAKDTLLKEYS